jgi:hypothetical protein
MTWRALMKNTLEYINANGGNAEYNEYVSKRMSNTWIGQAQAALEQQQKNEQFVQEYMKRSFIIKTQ